MIKITKILYFFELIIFIINGFLGDSVWATLGGGAGGLLLEQQPGPPEILPSPHNFTVLRGQPLILTCNVKHKGHLNGSLILLKSLQQVKFQEPKGPMEFLNCIFSWGFWAEAQVFSDSSFCPVLYPCFSVLQNDIHENTWVFLSHGFFLCGLLKPGIEFLDINLKKDSKSFAPSNSQSLLLVDMTETILYILWF